MKKAALILLIFCLLTNLSAQKFEIFQGDTINRIDENNQKQGPWIYFSNDYVDKITQKGSFKDNKKEGNWQTYYPDGTLKSEMNYQDNKQYGEVIVYYPNGKIQEQGFWKTNRWVGEYKYFHENGTVKYQWFFDDQGKRTGNQSYFYDNGKVQVEGEWIQGKEAGEVKEYYATGQVKKVSNFVEGSLNGSVTEYYADGQLKSKSVYVSGEVDRTQSYAYAPKDNSNNNNTNNEVNPEVNNKVATDPDYKLFNGTGYFKFINQNGQVDREGDFVEGVLVNGKKYIYDENGVKIKTAYIEDGKVVKVENEPANN